MALKTLKGIRSAFKIAILCYLFFIHLAFAVAILQSYQKTQLNHEKTTVYYLGKEGEDSFFLPKSYDHILQTLHVHSFTIPLVFFTFWILVGFTPIRLKYQTLLIGMSALSLLLYNLAPVLIRYASAKCVYLFSVGGIGMTLTLWGITLIILYEMFYGFREN